MPQLPDIPPLPRIPGLSDMPLLPMRLGRGRRVPVPDDWDTITQTDDGLEVPAEQLGLRPDATDRIWTAVQSFYRTGLHPGISLVIRRRGEVLLSRALGVARGTGLDGDDEPAVPLTSRTPMCLYSASKAVTAMLVHAMAEDGRLSLDDRVADHIPAFAANGKSAITLHHLMTHRAGLAQIPAVGPDGHELDVTDMLDLDLVLELLCNVEPDSDPGHRQAYHAATSGYLLGEVVRRVSGTTLEALLAERIADPLDVAMLTYGVPEPRRHEIALSYNTGPTSLPVISWLATRAIGTDPMGIAPMVNSDRAMGVPVPAVNVYTSAEDASRFFQMLLDGGTWKGRRLFATSTVHDALQPAGPLVIDGSLPAPVRFSAGFMLGERPLSLFGYDTPKAFGHLGFLQVLCWADPDREIAVGLLTNGKSVAPEGFVGFANLIRAISQHCTR